MVPRTVEQSAPAGVALFYHDPPPGSLMRGNEFTVGRPTRATALLMRRLSRC
jgi:hypothetical protein